MKIDNFDIAFGDRFELLLVCDVTSIVLGDKYFFLHTV